MVSLNRVVMNRTSKRWLGELPLEQMDVAEISGKFGRQLSFGTYSQFHYPEFDICAGPFHSTEGRVCQFDLILANQVWEHLERPYMALTHVTDMLRPGGYFWLAVPFFLPWHEGPQDCSRWSAAGLRNLLLEAGFEDRKIRAEQWGNRAAARRNLEDRWPPKYDKATDDLTNDLRFPICAWALAQRA